MAEFTRSGRRVRDRPDRRDNRLLIADTICMSGDSGSIFGRLFGRKKAKVEAIAGKSIVNEMAPGPILSLCLVYGRGADDAIADAGLNIALQILDRRKVKCSFACAAKLAETAATQLARIRDHGHEIVCHGYQQESPQKLDDMMLSRLLMRCREVLAKRGVHAAGYMPPTGTMEPRVFNELAKQGFKYATELKQDKADSPPRLVVGDPLPLVYLAISSNDSGYVRHPEDPKHVFNKHHSILNRTLHAKSYVALCYHTWMFGERKERAEDFAHVLDTAQGAGFKIMPLVEALPERFRPLVREVERNEWGL